MNKKRNLSKIAGLHTGTDKNGRTFYYGEVNEGSTLLVLPNMNGEGDGEGRFDFIAFFVPNNRYEQAEADTPTAEAARSPERPTSALNAVKSETKAAPEATPDVKSEPVKSPAMAPVEEKSKDAVAARVTQ